MSKRKRPWRLALRQGLLAAKELAISSEGTVGIRNIGEETFAGMNLTSILDQFHVLE